MANDPNIDKNKTIGEIHEEWIKEEYPDKQFIYDPKILYKFGKGRETLFIETDSEENQKSKHKPLSTNDRIVVSYWLDAKGKPTGKIKSLKLYDFMDLDLSLKELEELDNLNLVWELQPSGIVVETSQFLEKLRGVIRYRSFRFQVMDYFRDFWTIRDNLVSQKSLFGKRFFSLPYVLGNHLKYLIDKMSTVFHDYWGEGDDYELIDWNVDAFMEFDVHLTEKNSNQSLQQT